MGTLGFILVFLSIIGIVIGALMLMAGNLTSIPVLLASFLGLLVGLEIIRKG